MSRRFKGRHAKVQADPAAKPSPPVVLDDSNSIVDPYGTRTAKVLNHRHYARAESAPVPAADVQGEVPAAAGE